MKLEDYLVATTRTLPDLGSLDLNNTHMIMGMTTEVGELVDTHKRHLAYGKSIDTVNVKEEIGDVLWYISNYCHLNGIDLHEVMDMNIRKLAKRFPDKFTQDAALIRNLEVERAELEK